MLQLYDYFRASSAYRVRIALHLKDIPHEHVLVNLVKDGGEQFSEDYTQINPQQRVPTLITDNIPLQQSLAIIEYLDEVYPEPNLLPKDPIKRAQVRALAQIIACDMHALNNIRTLNYLKDQLNCTKEQKQQWYAYWIADGFSALEQRLQDNSDTGKCCFGDEPTLADICLIPQYYNALRFECDVTAYPILQRIYNHCETLPAFAAAHPSRQADAITN